MKDIFERNINTRVTQLDEEHILTRASLLDLAHNIIFEIRVNLVTKEIEDANAEMVKVPFGVCPGTLQAAKRIVGLKIERGIAKQINDLLGGSTGCTHFAELAMAAVITSSNVMIGMATDFKEWVDRRLPDGEYQRQTWHLLANSCYAYREYPDG
jgi:hypothetical protein